MDIYKHTFHLPLDPFGDYKFNEETDRLILQSTAYTIKEISKICHQNCNINNFDQKCVKRCTRRYFEGCDYLTQTLYKK